MPDLVEVCRAERTDQRIRDLGKLTDARAVSENWGIPNKEDVRMLCAVLLIASVLCANAYAIEGMETEAKSPAVDASSKTHAHATSARRARLGDEYKKITSFMEFRKKLFADGWKPVLNPDCREVVLGADYQGRCGKAQSDIECRVCQLVPELFRSTSDGYSVMHYIKDGTPLSVTVYGDMRELDEPGRYAGGWVVSGWEYTMSVNVIPLE